MLVILPHKLREKLQRDVNGKRDLINYYFLKLSTELTIICNKRMEAIKAFLMPLFVLDYILEHFNCFHLYNQFIYDTLLTK